MLQGTVRWFNRQRGFGSIAGDDGREYFVHQAAVEQTVPLESGMRVAFTATVGDQEARAVNVRVVQQGRRTA